MEVPPKDGGIAWKSSRECLMSWGSEPWLEVFPSSLYFMAIPTVIQEILPSSKSFGHSADRRSLWTPVFPPVDVQVQSQSWRENRHHWSDGWYQGSGMAHLRWQCRTGSEEIDRVGSYGNWWILCVNQFQLGIHWCWSLTGRQLLTSTQTNQLPALPVPWK